MILQNLVALCDREELLKDPDFQLKPVSYLVDINGEGEKVMCLVSGEMAVPVKKHLELKVPGASRAGAPLISFNNSAFESYGLKGNQNAPVGREAAEKYGTALRRLLDRNGWPGPDGDPLPRGNLLLPSNTTVLFWAEKNEDSMMEMFFGIGEGDKQAVKALYGSPWEGKSIRLDDATPFHTLVISGAQGRVILREAITTTVGAVLRSSLHHFNDLDIVQLSKEQTYPQLYKLLLSLKAPGDRAETPPALVTNLHRAAIDANFPYPAELLAMAIARIRAHTGVSDNRVRLIKAVLNRKDRKGHLHSPFGFKPLEKRMDTKNTTVPYRLGRLLAALEKIQQEAISAKAGVVDRFLGAACGTPALVFPRLLNMHHHHVKKLADGRAIFFAKLVDDILAPIPGEFPRTLSLDEQGVFMIGYHHQRADFWTRKEDREKDQNPDAE